MDYQLAAACFLYAFVIGYFANRFAYWLLGRFFG
jgi:hypothetical protein